MRKSRLCSQGARGAHPHSFGKVCALLESLCLTKGHFPPLLGCQLGFLRICQFPNRSGPAGLHGPHPSSLDPHLSSRVSFPSFCTGEGTEAQRVTCPTSHSSGMRGTGTLFPEPPESAVPQVRLWEEAGLSWVISPLPDCTWALSWARGHAQGLPGRLPTLAVPLQGPASPGSQAGPSPPPRVQSAAAKPTEGAPAAEPPPPKYTPQALR